MTVVAPKNAPFCGASYAILFVFYHGIRVFIKTCWIKNQSNPQDYYLWNKTCPMKAQKPFYLLWNVRFCTHVCTFLLCKSAFHGPFFVEGDISANRFSEKKECESAKGRLLLLRKVRRALFGGPELCHQMAQNRSKCWFMLLIHVLNSSKPQITPSGTQFKNPKNEKRDLPQVCTFWNVS